MRLQENIKSMYAFYTQCFLVIFTLLLFMPRNGLSDTTTPPPTVKNDVQADIHLNEHPRHKEQGIKGISGLTAPRETGGGAAERIQSQAPIASQEPQETSVDAKRKERAKSPGNPAKKSTDDAVLLNFIDADLKDILHTISEITGKNFILGTGVSGKITVQASTPVPRKEVLGIFESILEVNGLSAVPVGDYYKILPGAAAKQRGVEVKTGIESRKVQSGDKLVTHIVPVKFISAKDLTPILQPMLSPAGGIFNYSKTNTLIVTDISSNIKKVLEIINVLDIDAFKRMDVALIKIKNVDITTLYKELSDLLQPLGLGKDAKQLSVVPLKRLNSLIVFSTNTQLLMSVKGWIDRLDRSPLAGGTPASNTPVLHIYYMQNDSASNIKSILDQIISTGGAAPSTGSSPKGANIQLTPSITARSKVNETMGGISGDIRIFLYEPLNALLIQASERNYRQLVKIIKQLDRLPKQVLIDALIVEITLDKDTKYGIQWSALSGNVSTQQNTGIFSTTIQDPKSAISTPVGLAAPSGLTFLATDASKFFGVIQALASSGKINVLSNPHIVVKNYGKATISVGSDEPIATQSTQTAVTGTESLIQNIEYRKTGIILTVTPRITDGGMVAMNIRQEISDISTSRVVGVGTFPSFSKREAETSVVSKDKQTIVIGGLIKRKDDRTISGIPLLSKIPLLGNLFKYATDSNEKTELVILLTPVIISNAEQAASLTEEIKNRIEGLKKVLQDNDRQN